MKILGAATQHQTPQPRYGEVMAIDYALAAAADALAQAGVLARRLDLIVTFSVSPSHLSDAPEIMGPRLGHPLQRDLGAKRAIVFDLLDCDWCFAIDVVQGFFSEMGFSRALIVRAESLQGIRQMSSDINLSDGAGALVLAPGEDATWQPAYADLDLTSDPAWIAPIEAGSADSKYVDLHFRATTSLALAIEDTRRQLWASLHESYGEIATRCTEDWLLPRGASSERRGQSAAFAVPASLRQLLDRSERPRRVACSTFDPFKLRLAAYVVEL